MPVFIYNVEQNGKMVKGEVTAKSLQLARMKLKARHIDPVYIKEKPFMPFFSGGGKIKRATILFFTRQMAFLLGSGVSLVKALEICIASSDNANFKSVLQIVLSQLEGGKSFSRCLQSRPDVFDGFYVNMVVCAEETGRLDEVLKDLADYMERADYIASKVKSSMIYPALVMAISFLIITGIILFVVPKFEALYGSNKNAKLPALTQSLIDLSDLMRNNILIFLIFLIGIPIVFFQYSKTEQGKKTIQGIIKALPLFGKIQYQASMVRFFRSFFSLLKSGVNFLDALDVSHNVAGQGKVQRGISISKEFVTKGKSFAKGLETSGAFPSLVYHMAKIGEESGNMDHTFEKLAVYYEERLNNLIDGLIKMIEPLCIVFVGGIIGIIVLALYLPVFYMGSVIQ